MKKILVSACLLGEPCRYDGQSKPVEVIEELRKKFDLVPFCPEVEGGLKTPRLPAERRGNYIKRQDGVNLTKNYELGAEKALNLCKFLAIEVAILKENSPSCGVHQIHSGFFDGRLKEGKGLTTALLEKNGIKVYSEHEVLDFLAALNREEEAKREAYLAREEKKQQALEERKAKAAEEFKKQPREHRPYPKKKEGGFQKDGKRSFKKPFGKSQKGRPFKKKSAE